MSTQPLYHAPLFRHPLTSTTAAAGQTQTPAVQAAVSLAWFLVTFGELTIYCILGASKLHHSNLFGVGIPSNILLRPLLGSCHSCTAGTMVSGPLAALGPDSNNSRRRPFQQHAGFNCGLKKASGQHHYHFRGKLGEAVLRKAYRRADLSRPP